MTRARPPSGLLRRVSGTRPEAVLVDGYNLLHAIPQFAPRGADLAAARAQLERWLAESARRAGVHEVVLVWDGGGIASAAPHARGTLRIVFTPAHESADQRLLTLCRERYAERAATTWVVSSDRDVRGPAGELGFEVLGAMTFFRRWSTARPRGGCAREAARTLGRRETEPDAGKPFATRREVDELLERFLAEDAEPATGDDPVGEDRL